MRRDAVDDGRASQSVGEPGSSPFPTADDDRVDTDEIQVVGEPSTDADHPYGEDDAVDPVVAEADEDGGDGGEAARPRPVLLIVTLAIFTVLLIAAAAVVAHLWRVTEAWEQQNADVIAQNYELGEMLAAEREDLATAYENIELLNDQLSASKDTVLRLQAQNAQWGDDAAFAQEEIELLETTIYDATAVANSLSRCIEGHEQLLEYLETPDDFEEDELDSFATSVDDLCIAAQDAYLAYQQSVAP